MDSNYTDSYWECKCEFNYIHPNTHDECKICYALRDNIDVDKKIN